MKKVTLSLIRFYQKTYVFHIGILQKLFMMSEVCRFKPSCSQYTYEAVEIYGAGKGLLLGVKRISRCHPWNKGGYDPVK